MHLEDGPSTKPPDFENEKTQETSLSGEEFENNSTLGTMRDAKSW